VLWTLAMRGGDRAWVATAAMLLFFPLMFGFYLGQPTGLLLYSFYRAYRALETGQDLRAGLWLGGLLVKPQYTVFLALVLVWKRRWHTVGGLAAVGAAVILASLLLLGPSGTRAYLALLTAAGGYHTAISEIASQIMISWHGLLAALAPALAETPTLVLTAALSALSVAALIPIWRGPWQPHDQRFAGQMLATMVVTMLAGYDVNIHGAALLMVPGAVLILTKPATTPHLTLLRLAFFLPGATLPFALDLTGSLTGEAVLITLLQAAIMAVLAHTEFVGRRPTSTPPQQAAQELFAARADGRRPQRISL
jgi:hypothetical protein